jgi:hypothetical protein
MWIVNQRRDKLINTANVKQIRCFEDGEITADGTTLGKYKDTAPVMTQIVSTLTSAYNIKIMLMPEEEEEI